MEKITLAQNRPGIRSCAHFYIGKIEKRALASALRQNKGKEGQNFRFRAIKKRKISTRYLNLNVRKCC